MLPTFLLLRFATVAVLLLVKWDSAGFALVVFDIAGLSNDLDFDFRFFAFFASLAAYFAAFLACFAAFFSAFLASFSSRFASFAAFFSAFLAFFSAFSFAFAFVAISTPIESLENDPDNRSAYELV